MTDDEITVAVEAASVGPIGLARRAAVPGLAAVGRVIAAGAGGRHLEGKRVVIGPHQACGDCDVCRRAGAPVCPAGRTLGVDAPGAAAATVTARARWALPLEAPLEVPGPAAALLGHEAALAYAMYARAGVGPGTPTAVIGDGPVARLLAQILAGKNAAPRPVAELGDAPATLFVCDGPLGPAVAHANRRATVAIATLEVEPGPIDPAVLAREATIVAVVGAHPDLFPEVAALVVRGELDLAAVAEVAPLATLPAALARGDRTRALVVTP